MGGKRKGNWRGGGGGGGKHQRGEGGGRGKRGNGEWFSGDMVERTNEEMEAYYKAQLIVPEGEWDAFLAAARDNLPTTFRVSPIGTFSADVQNSIQTTFANLKIPQEDLKDGDDRLEPPKQLDWYPGGLAWGMSISKKALKRTPALEAFHKYIVAQTETGYLTRQEAVSMIPPLFLDVKPQHRVLDMCAAPGSKTSQLLEFIHHMLGDNPVPSGMLVANDADQDRCSMLVHQMKRINSPSLLICNHEGQKLPMLWQRTAEYSKKESRLLYDRILADVPCSGDGTMRKNLDVWRKWSPAQGMGLHKLQGQILTRGVEMLADDGIIVYSTCSMNPSENESVVAAVLKKFQGQLELVDVSGELPKLKRMPGLHTWKVRDRKDKDTWYDTHESVPQEFRQQFNPTMWPPSPEEAQAMHLERCVRVLPHQQDTGAFFICKLRKIPKVVAEADPEPTAPMDDSVKEAGAGADVVGKKDGEAAEGGDTKMGEEGEGKKEGEETKKGSKREKQPKKNYEVLIPVKDDSLVDSLIEFYGLKDFPKQQLMTTSDVANKLYFVSEAVQEMLAADVKQQLKVIGAGVKMFEKNPTKNGVFDFRLRQEGVPFLLPYMTKRIAKMKSQDFLTLLFKRSLLMDSMVDEPSKQALKDMDGGCALFVLDDPKYTGANTVFLAGWRGNMQLTLFVSKFEQASLCSFFEMPDNLKKDEKKEEKKEEKEEDAVIKKESGGEVAAAPSGVTEDGGEEGFVMVDKKDAEGAPAEETKASE